jgi:hypothetical protein
MKHSRFGSWIEQYDLQMLPVQVCGALNGSTTRDGRGVEIFPNIREARIVYPDLYTPDLPRRMMTRFNGPMRGGFAGAPAMRFESVEAYQMYSMQRPFAEIGRCNRRPPISTNHKPVSRRSFMTSKTVLTSQISLSSSNPADCEQTGILYVSLTHRKAIEVRSLSEASTEVRRFIELNDLGSSDFVGGDVYDLSTNRKIGRVSYNGRIWDLDGHEISSL